MNEKLRIELCSNTRLGKGPFYAELELPATAEQIRDAKQRARIVSADDAGSVSISIIEFDPIPELEEVRLDTTTVEELNFLAMRMDALCEEQFLVYRALFDKRFEDMGSDGLLSAKDLINMTYGIDDVVVASGIDTDEQLGQFVIETIFTPILRRYRMIRCTFSIKRRSEDSTGKAKAACSSRGAISPSEHTRYRRFTTERASHALPTTLSLR